MSAPPGASVVRVPGAVFRSGRTGRGPSRWSWPILVLWAVLMLYLWSGVDAYWVPDDEGLLGQTAERILMGELPHRDFADPYTGGLGLLHAFAFQLTGVDLLHLRYQLLFFTALWIPLLYACASRFTGIPGSLGVTALAVVWSIPNYPAAMPSWYGLFLATAGLLGLLLYFERGSRRWLFLAGVAGGVSILIKISGLYFVAAALLSLVVRSAHVGAGPGTGSSAPWYRVIALGGLSAFVLALILLVKHDLTPPHLFHLVLPGAALALLAAREVRRATAGGAASHLRELLLDSGVLIGGVVLPLAAFAIPYVTTESVGALVHGVFVAPTARIADAAFPPRPVATALPALGLMLMIVLLGSEGRRTRSLALGAVFALVVLSMIPSGTGTLFWLGWLAMSQQLPLLVAAGCVLLVKRADAADAPEGDRSWLPTYACLAVAALISLMQYPFAAPIYFCYAAPLVILAATAVWRLSGRPRAGGAIAALVAMFLFAVAWMNGGAEQMLWYGLRPRVPVVHLDIARASLRVPPPDALEYRAVTNAVRKHARGGYTYAGPEAPEIYFLTGLRNPTRMLLEFADATAGVEPDLAKLRERGVTAIAINRRPKFSRPFRSSVYDDLVEEFPASVDIGRFTVRWKQ